MSKDRSLEFQDLPLPAGSLQPKPRGGLRCLLHPAAVRRKRAEGFNQVPSSIFRPPSLGARGQPRPGARTCCTTQPQGTGPAAQVKIHLQAQAASEIAVGHQYKHQGMFQALTEIGQKHGLVGLWRGALGSLPRVIIGSSTQLCTFSSTKDLLSQWEIFPPQSWKLALVATMVSSIAMVLSIAPFDVACTRLYNQPTNAQGKGLMYRGILDALLQTARTEGICGIYKGIGASYFRLGPHTILSLFFWDQLRSLYYTYAK
ncbi:solute carrier family 25 member 35 isoform X2 [Saimiri boliviensis]|uniref:solute carrier family 25 member 35 isoform X2 n=1 Tax=Saimiri boliviensis TaxID=27679 RepID=UPI000533D16A|nr:solute carrier family 25 member 35 isoform X2 [Saimiri boliviensis boliviensis]